MKKLVLDFFRGIFIGIAIVIPGFSAGGMSVVLNIYERFVNAFSNLLQKPIQTMKDMWSLFIGMAVGVVGSIKILVWLLTNAPIPTALFFVGLIVGSLPRTYQNANKSKVRVLDIVLLIVGMAIVVTLPFIRTDSVTNYEFNFPMALTIFFLTMLASTANVVPGVSGSMILLALGYYEIIWVNVIGNFFDAVLTFQFSLIFQTAIPVIPFGLGVIIGMVLVAKLVELLLRKATQAFYYTILGLLAASPFAIIYSVYQEYQTAFLDSKVFSWVLGILLFFGGVFAVIYLQKHEKGEKNVKTVSDNN
jgi:putative membrane protein